ncbi:MAG TPA: hypothetical protein VMH87_14565 [Pseudomonadales bacterium]|nr:hypothetical protein [Pseudomonadales bacterium]
MKNQHSNLSNTSQLFAAIGALCLLAAGITAQAQLPSTNLPPEQNFFQSVGNYFTSANTNYTWTSNTLEVAIGADYMSGANWANYVAAQFDAGRFDIGAKVRNVGIAGTVESAEAGIGYSLIEFYSVKLEAGIDGGYDLNHHSAIFEPQITLRAKLTPNTFLGISLSLPIWTNGKLMNNVPSIGIETGFTY